MKQSKELTAFYRAYLKWVEDGTPHDWEPFSFRKSLALCSNLRNFMRRTDPAYEIMAMHEMSQQFLATGLCTSFPFYTDGNVHKWAMFCHEQRKHTFHLNAQRMAWVRAHAKVRVRKS